MSKVIRIDQKEKVLAILDRIRTTNTVAFAKIGMDPDLVAKLIIDFENPTIEKEELFRRDLNVDGEAKEDYNGKRIEGEHSEEPNPQSITLKSFEDAAKLIKGFEQANKTAQKTRRQR